MKILSFIVLLCFHTALNAQDDDYNKKIEKRKNKISADRWESDKGNEDGVYKARDKKTHKWGMYQITDEFTKILIPMKYDTVRFFNFNGPFTLVWNNGKVGVFVSPWIDTKGQSIECIYEDGKVVHDKEDNYYFAAKKNGKWGWVDFYTGEEQSAFTASSYSELKLTGNELSKYYH